MKITFETKAWITEYNRKTPAELRTPEGASSLFYSGDDHSGVGNGWTLAGTATITLDLVDDRVLVDNKVASLREQAANIRAEATGKAARIEGQIQQLLCIENSPAAAPDDDDDWPF